jgi:pullulanase/glycogen debranching enzyme
MRTVSFLAVLSLFVATAPLGSRAGFDDPAPADDSVTVDGQTDDAAYTMLGTSPAAPGSGFTGGVLTLKAHRGPDSLYVAVEGKLRAGENDDTFREMMILVNATGTDGVDRETPLPPGDDGASPFCCVGGMQMDRETDYGVRLTGGNSAVAYPSVIDYAGFVSGDSTDAGEAIDSFEETVPSLDGTPVTGDAFGGVYAYQDAADLSSVDGTGFEFALPYSSLAIEPGDAVQFFAFYGDVEGDNVAATLIPDDESDATYGNSEDWTSVPGTQYTDFLGTVQEPFVSANIISPDGNPPLYPFMASTDTTVNVSVSVDTANVSLTELRLFVDSSQVASTTNVSLSYDLTMDTPNRYQIRAEAEVVSGDSTIVDSASTFLIRTPNVVEEARPSGTQDGINYNSDGSVTLSLYAPKKDFAYVLGDFNNWEIDPSYFMKKNGDRWWITLSSSEIQSQTEYAFQYFVDGTHRIADPLAHKILQPVDQFVSDQTYPDLKTHPDSLTENPVSVLEKGRPDFNFDNPNFTPPPRDELVVYELLLRDFLEQNNFQTLTDTLDYLDRLGINAIELMPVSEFYGNSSWGYNPLFHLALEKSYGTRTAFKEFVQAAHNRDIAVIMDVVYNHIDTPSPLRQLYSSAEESPFLESGPDRGICGVFFEELNQASPFIKNYIDRANKYWVEEFNVDGFRFDLAKCVADNGVNINDPAHSDAVVSDWKDVSDYVWDSVDEDTYMILEFFGSPNEENELGGYRDDDGDRGSMMTWHNMNRPYSEVDMGYVGGTSGFGADLLDAYFGNRSGYDQPSFIAYMESHDEQWLMRRKKAFGRSSDNTSYGTADFDTALDRQKAIAAFYFTVPGPKMTWQFGEVGYGWGPGECLKESPACSADDPSRTGPKPVRWAYADSTQSPERDKLYKTWKALLRLRNNHEVFTGPRTGSQESISMKVANEDIVHWIKLEDENLDAVVVGNFGVNVRTATLDFPQTGTWYNFFKDTELQVDDATQSFSLRPGEFRIYTSNQLQAPPAGLVPSAPTFRSTATVGSNGTQDFGNTGVVVAFSGVGGSGEVVTEKLNEAPLGTDGIDESNASQYRFVVEAGGDLSFDDATEIRLNVSTLGGIDDANNVTIYQRPTEDTGSFTALTTSYNSTEDELVAPISSADTLGEFVLASNSEPLPVELSGFDARVDDDAVRLTWQTAAETNNAEFRVQRRPVEPSRRAGSTNWKTIGQVEGAGTTTDAQSYRFVDQELPFEADRLAYRLAQVDADGSVRHSKKVTVRRSVRELTLQGTFPNPARRQVTVQYALPASQTATLRLYDMLGRRVKTVTQGEREGWHEVQLDVSGLTSGVYFLRLTAGGRTRMQRLTVVR